MATTTTTKLVLDLIAKDNASATLRKLGVAADGSVDKMALLNKASRTAAVGLTAWSAAAVLSVKAAAEESEQQAKLAQTLEKATGATAEQAASTDEMLTQMGLATGVADDELRPALSKLAIATGDLTTSQDLLSVALDASVALGKDVETVAVALGKAYNGNVGALGRLGIATKDAQGNSLTFAQVLADLKSKTEGAAEAAGEAAPWKRLQVAVGEAQEQIGAGLLPIVSKASTVMADMGPGAMTAAFAVTGVGLAAVTVVPKVIEFKKAIEGVSSAQKAMALSSKALGVAMALEATAAAGSAVGLDRINDSHYKNIDTVDAAITKTEQWGWATDKVIETEHMLSKALEFATFGTFDMSNAVDESTTKIEAQDAAWASLVSSGKMKTAYGQYQDLAAALKAQGYSTDDILKLFPHYLSALEDSAGASQEAAKASNVVSAALDKQSAATDRATNAWKAYIGLPLDAAAAEISYRDAVKSTTDTLRDETKTRDEKRSAVIDEIRAAEDLREAEISNGASVKESTDKYNAHIKAIREAADKAGVLKGRTDSLRDALARLPSNIRIAVGLTVDPYADQVAFQQQTGGGHPVYGLSSPFAAGGWTRSASRAWARVGEYGPELLNTRTGYVMPHSQSLRAAEGGPTVVQNFYAPQDPVAVGRETAKALKHYKRSVGGAALGIA